MLHAPPHLTRPLSIDTNISYDLDMNLFPGLEDPQHMYQPALLIATDWNQYVWTDDTECADTDSRDNSFCLIESCDVMSDDPLSFLDPDTFESLLDDVISDTASFSSETFDFLDMSADISPITDTYSLNIPVDNVDHGYYSTTEENTLTVPRLRGQKRPRSDDSEYPDTKKSKISDFTSLRLPALVSVCPTSNQCVMHRDS